ncbi:MAG: N-acetylmuramic acid 6-phosphate etherase [Chthoniobacterales bacterium]
MQRILGIDGGATKTEWALFSEQDGNLNLLEQGRAGSGSYKLETCENLESRLQMLPKEVDAVGIYLAGCVTEEDRAEINALAKSVWPQARIAAGSDRDSAYASAFLDKPGVLIIAGTGSAVTGKSGDHEERAGGWGHVLGDSGGGYDLSVRMLRRILWDYDVEKTSTPFAHDVLRTLHFQTLAALSDWALNASKAEIAALSPIAFRHQHDPEIQEILETGANTLATYSAAVAKRLKMDAPTIRLFGGLFHAHRTYGDKLRKHAHRLMPHCVVESCTRAASWGAAWLATHSPKPQIIDTTLAPETTTSLSTADTERVNSRSANLDTMSIPQMVELFIEEESNIPDALTACGPEICAAVGGIIAALGTGGRLFYVGAGTSGRLGVLDASEIPPTFGMPPKTVQGLIAGGRSALWSSVEGAEDDSQAGIIALHERGLCEQDVVCGIAASGRTPYVLGSLDYAQKMGCFTIFLTCNPSRAHSAKRADVEIDLPTGPEILTGSTRLKAGSATKAVLNILTTCAMVRLGHVTGNTMTKLTPTNDKLRERAVRIVAEKLHCEESRAWQLLSENGWNVNALLNTVRKDTDAPVL